jgi:hypothetical protein
MEESRNEEPNIITIIKSRGSAGHVLRTGDNRNLKKLVGKPKTERRLLDLFLVGSIILKWIIKK